MVMEQQIPAHGKATMIRTKTHKYVHRLYEHDELYDLEADPQELVNLAEDERLRPLKAALKERLMRFYLETSDVVPHRGDPRD